MENTHHTDTGQSPYADQRSTDDHGEFLRLIVGVWRRRNLVLAITLAATVAMFVLTAMKPSQYTASATLLLDPRQQQLAASSDQVVSDLDISDPVMANEIAMLRSSTLLERVVQRIGIDEFTPIDPGLASQGLSTRLAQYIRRALGINSYDQQDFELISLEERRLNRIVQSLRNGLRIKRVDESYVIDVSITTGLAQLSAEVANTLAQIYLETQLRERQKVIEKATDWLSDQVALREGELTQAERRVEQAKKDNLDYAGASPQVLEQQALSLNQALSSVRADKTRIKEELEILESIPAENLLEVNLQPNAYPAIAALQSTRRSLVQEEARLSILYGPNHPKRRLLDAEFSRVESEFAREVTKQKRNLSENITALAARETSLSADILEIERGISNISERSLTLRQLETEANAIRDGYETALTRLADTRAQLQIQRAEAKVVNAAAIPAGPSAPRIKLMTGFGASLGLSLGLILALLMEILEKGFRRDPDIERATGVRVLTRLPIKRSAASECLYLERIRQLWTVLSKRMNDEASVIMMTSSMPGEGKTTTAMNLANAAASMGRSVVLLDLDTRQKSLSRQVGLFSGPDLHAHLTQGCDLDEVIHSADDLSFDFAGIGPETVGAPIYSGRVMRALFANLKKRYDIVIVDAPPLLPVSDSLSIAPLVDQVLFVVQYGATARGSVADGLATLRNIGVVPEGIVMSWTDPRTEPRGYPQQGAIKPALSSGF
ncbi:MAG: polysaccharide biosynthesis tyrosine autokinase [Pseudomonadota bacterium]|nr:polysaccharide biosynthesis tyrosine autokinase [Pseudomonadota bacterium]